MARGAALEAIGTSQAVEQSSRVPQARKITPRLIPCPPLHQSAYLHLGWDPARAQIVFGLKLVSDGSRPLIGAERRNFTKFYRQLMFPDDLASLQASAGPCRGPPGGVQGGRHHFVSTTTQPREISGAGPVLQ